MNNGTGHHKKTILITGASGFIGSRLTAYFNGKYSVYGLTRNRHCEEPGDEKDNASRMDCFAGARNDGVGWLQGDFGNADQITDILNQINPDAVIHCAGVTPHNAQSDDDYIDINVKKSSVLLNEVKKNEISNSLIYRPLPCMVRRRTPMVLFVKMMSAHLYPPTRNQNMILNKF